MARGSKKKYTSKQKRQAEHIAQGYKKRGTSSKTAKARAWATVHSSAVPSEPMELDLQTQAGTCGDSYAPCPDRGTPAHVNAQIKWVAAYAVRAPK